MRLQTYKITPYSGRLRLRINPVIIEIINPINNPPISPNAAIIPGEMNLLCISVSDLFVPGTFQDLIHIVGFQQLLSFLV